MTTPQPPAMPQRPRRGQPAAPAMPPRPPQAPQPRRGAAPVPAGPPAVQPAFGQAAALPPGAQRPQQPVLQQPAPPQQIRARGSRAQPPGRPGEPSASRATAALSRSRAWARPARTGARIAAYSIDVLVVVLVSVLVGVLTRSVLLGVLLGLELVAVLLVLEARTGATIGNLLLRMRTTRDDSPFSPGIARAAIRGLVQGAGSLVALVGGWVVVATSAADPLRSGRSIADRAGRTIVVQVPSRVEREEWARSATNWATSAPQPVAAAQAPQVGREAERPLLKPVQPAAPVVALGRLPQQTGQPDTGQPVLGQPILGQRPGAQPAPAPVLPEGVVSVDAPIATPPVRNVEVGEHLLLTFDTGQREQLPTPLSVNLGRKPERSDGDDLLLVVRDPEGSVSKTHLRVEFRGGSVWLTDQGSTNGTEIFDDSGEGTVLEPGARVRLEEGSRVRIGSRSFTVATVLGETVR